ncbi:hypothetical protein CLU79DRAFT_882192 [Phycomyces nitens]|nr:hypothetical protein CLU79DRAFT_882192 [Phycomyces nitens]
MLSSAAFRTTSLSNALTPSDALSSVGSALPVAISSGAPLSLALPAIPSSLAVGVACAALAAPFLLQTARVNYGASGPAAGPVAGPSVAFGQDVVSVPVPALGLVDGRFLTPATPALRVFRRPTEAPGRKRKHDEITGGDQEVCRPTSRRRIGEYVPSDHIPSEDIPAPRGTKRSRTINADELETVYKRVKARHDAGPVVTQPHKDVGLSLHTSVIRREHFLELEDLYLTMEEARKEFIKRQQPVQTPSNHSEENMIASSIETQHEESAIPMEPLAENIGVSPVSSENSPVSGSSGEPIVSDVFGESGEQAHQTSPWKMALDVAAAVKRFFSL